MKLPAGEKANGVGKTAVNCRYITENRRKIKNVYRKSYGSF
ncbi:hypothetical protein CLOSTHATH_05050 [Hungatella hathewayi DSM 13479]|uniref:Uncharacterized protein n=1 Tax=Hungatella hathewayi DSM 13479 TaxID=566550 RepID=D3AN50_9FIRM|nr:hypothetical protein CLOSTHATH_05050 [Hungatella hathewayi DSM 13479]